MIMEISLKRVTAVLTHFIFRTRIRRTDDHLCTCHTLDCVEGRGSSLHHHSDCYALHPLYLIQGKKIYQQLFFEILSTRQVN